LFSFIIVFGLRKSAGHCAQQTVTVSKTDKAKMPQLRDRMAPVSEQRRSIPQNEGNVKTKL
jgi:hypothetical protein